MKDNEFITDIVDEYACSVFKEAYEKSHKSTHTKAWNHMFRQLSTRVALQVDTNTSLLHAHMDNYYYDKIKDL